MEITFAIIGFGGSLVLLYFLIKLLIWSLPYVLYVVNIILCFTAFCFLFINWGVAICLFLLVGISECLRSALIKPAILSMLKKMGMGTPEQIAKRAKKSIDDTGRILEELVKSGKVESVSIANGIAYKIIGDDFTGENFERNEAVISLD